MRLSLAIILLHTLSMQLPASGAEIRTISDIDRLVRAGRPGETDFVLTGTVQRVKMDKRRFVASDGTGDARFLLLDSISNIVTHGDRLVMKGRVRISPLQETDNVLTQADVISHEPVRPAVDITLADIDGARHHLRVIRTEGIVTDAFPDQIDPTYFFLIVRDGNISLPVSAPRTPESDFNRLVGARLGITGIFHSMGTGDRKFSGPFLDTYTPEDIRILVPPPRDPFDVPPLESRLYLTPAAVTRLGPRRITGDVLAVWGRDRFMLRAEDGRIANISLISSLKPPACGTRLTVAGYPETDMFRINLTKATYRNEGTGESADEHPSALTPAEIFLDEEGHRKIRSLAHGFLLRVRGVLKGIPTPTSLECRALVQCGDFTLSIDPGTHPKIFDELSTACDIEVTGRCLIESDNWQPEEVFPRIKNVAIVIRTPDDIRILSHAPFWTPQRLLVIIAALVGLVIGIYIWNRILNRLVERRSRALLHEQLARMRSELKIGERTRLAVELHDSMSQTLGGIACQIAASGNAMNDSPNVARQRLRTAERMLDSCRTELRHCLFDLRSDTLGEHDLAVAIRRTLEALEGDAEIAIDVDIARRPLPDSTVHAILSIIRELVGNALRHGMAATVRITGHCHDGQLVFCVTDDGCGFDPENCVGPAEGHFGLQGIRDRITKLHGTVCFDSTTACGTTVTVSLPKPEPNNAEGDL